MDRLDILQNVVTENERHQQFMALKLSKEAFDFAFHLHYRIWEKYHNTAAAYRIAWLLIAQGEYMDEVGWLYMKRAALNGHPYAAFDLFWKGFNPLMLAFDVDTLQWLKAAVLKGHNLASQCYILLSDADRFTPERFVLEKAINNLEKETAS